MAPNDKRAGEDLEIIDQALEILVQIKVDIDPWETEWPGVISSDKDTNPERHSEIGNGWSVDVTFVDCDIKMEDNDI